MKDLSCGFQLKKVPLSCFLLKEEYMLPYQKIFLGCEILKFYIEQQAFF